MVKVVKPRKSELYGLLTDFGAIIGGAIGMTYCALSLDGGIKHQLGFLLSAYLSAKGVVDYVRFTRDIEKRFDVEEIK